jgi:hypothetical protein
MTRKITFVKEEDHRWFVVLPEWEGDKDDLEMILGADTMLDVLADGNTIVDLLISDEPFNHKFELKFVREDLGGSFYQVGEPVSMEIWLCEIVKFVFGEFPKTIYGS